MASADSLRKSFTYRRWTSWALPLRTCQEKFSTHTRFCPQAQPTRACCEGLALRAISLRTSLLSGCAALNSKRLHDHCYYSQSSCRLFSTTTPVKMQAVQHDVTCIQYIPSATSSRTMIADDDDCDFTCHIIILITSNEPVIQSATARIKHPNDRPIN